MMNFIEFNDDERAAILARQLQTPGFDTSNHDLRNVSISHGAQSTVQQYAQIKKRRSESTECDFSLKAFTGTIPCQAQQSNRMNLRSAHINVELGEHRIKMSANTKFHLRYKHSKLYLSLNKTLVEELVFNKEEAGYVATIHKPKNFSISRIEVIVVYD